MNKLVVALMVLAVALALALLGIAGARTAAGGPAIATAQGLVVTIDFENDPGPDGLLGTVDDLPLPEGTFIADQFAALGVRFFLVGLLESPYIASEGSPAAAFGNQLLGNDTPAPSPVNTLSDGGAVAPTVVPGASSVDAEYGAAFATPVSMVGLSLIDFGDCGPPVPFGDPVTAHLVAFDAGGAEVGRDSFTIARFPAGGDADGNVARLEVAAPGIARVQTEDTAPDCGTAIDDFTFEFPPLGPTPVGPNVCVPLNGWPNIGGLRVCFSTVTSAGNTTVVATSPCPPGLASDTDFVIWGLGGQSTCYHLNTTASFSGLVEVCIKYDESGLTPRRQSNLTLKHKNPVPPGPPWTDITTSLDTVNDIICADTDTFSIFTVQAPTPVGGIVELAAGSSDSAAAGPGSSALPYATIAGVVAAGALALAAMGGWYAWRRFRQRRI